MNQHIKSRLSKVKALLNDAPRQKLSANKSAKILAMLGVGSKPNLRLLNKMIGRGHITAPEVVNAVGEALLLRRVNRRVIEAITMALSEALGSEDVGSEDVVDVESAA